MIDNKQKIEFVRLMLKLEVLKDLEKQSGKLVSRINSYDHPEHADPKKDLSWRTLFIEHRKIIQNTYCDVRDKTGKAVAEIFTGQIVDELFDRFASVLINGETK